MKLLKNAGIYMLRNCDNGNCYVGKDNNLGSRAERHLSLKIPGCRAIHNAIKQHGRDAFKVDLIHYPNIGEKALYEVEKWKIRQLGSHKSQGGYNLTWGGEGFDSETSRETQQKRIADGTHNFLSDGFQKGVNRKRIEDGTHNFQDSEFQRKYARKKALKRLADGTHHFLDSEFQRGVNRKRIEDGTHNFQDSEFARKNALKRIEEGTHNLLDPQVGRKGRYTQKIKKKNKRREFYRWVSVILTAKSVCEERLYRKRIRDGFFDKEIPDTSKSEQLDLF